MNIPYHLALRLGRWRRWWYSRRLRQIEPRPLPSQPEMPVHFFGFSSHRDMPEQVASLRSLAAYAGVPRQTTIVSDGSHTREDKEILKMLSLRPTIVDWSEFVSPDVPAAVLRYAARHPLGKKLAAVLSMHAEGAFLYADSDILFFPGAQDLRSQLAVPGSAGGYQLDCYPSVDDRLLDGDEDKRLPVNAGFFYCNRPLDWSSALERLERLTGEATHFTEQTVIHLALKAAGARPLPPEKYVLANDDQWLWRDLHTGPEVAMRHYISSFRHKFWMKVRH